MRIRVLPTASALIATLVFAAPLRADVIVVDGAGGGDFTTLAAAVAAASDGDTLLIRGPGPYFGSVFNAGKALEFIGEPGGVSFFGGIEIDNVPAGKRVVVRGLTMQAAFGPHAGVWLHDNDGSVWIENCTAKGGKGIGQHHGCVSGVSHPGGAGLLVENSDAVVVVRCELTGGNGDDWWYQPPLSTVNYRTDGGPGARIVASNVALFESTLTAGHGGLGAALCGPDAHGGDGLSVAGAMLLISACAAAGGLPGSGAVATGGDGLVIDGASLVQRLGGTLSAGPGGTTIVNAGVLEVLAGTARSFAISSPLREGQPGTLSMTGVQGDFVGFFWAFEAGLLPMPARSGWFLLNAPFLAGPFFVGTIAAGDGVWNLPISGPLLPAGLESQTLLLQAYFQSPGGTTLASGTAFTIVDAAL